MTEELERKVFERHLPEKAVDYCFSLWKSLQFNFRITKNRQTKFGDYRYDPSDRSHSVSINHDQNQYAFLVTYIHEVAHKVAFDKFQNRVDPHGKEWKMEFKKLMIPMLREDIFPMDILSLLAKHMKNPKASTVSDKHLYEVLKKYDAKQSGLLLKQVDIGAKFLFRKKIYRKLESRRTRSLCELSENGKKYLISETASVHPFKHSE